MKATSSAAKRKRTKAKTAKIATAGRAATYRARALKAWRTRRANLERK
jgi:hypothetical protein